MTEIGASYADFTLQDTNGLIGVASFGGKDWGFYAIPHFRAKWDIVEAHLGATYSSNPMALTEWIGFVRLYVEVLPEKVDLFAGATVGLSSSNGLDDLWGLQAGVRWKF